MGKVIFIANNQLEYLKSNINIVMSTGITPEEISVVDTGSNDGTLEWLGEVGLNYIAGTIEEDGFGTLINAAAKEFVGDDDFLLLCADTVILPEDMTRIWDYIKEDDKSLAYTFETLKAVGSDFKSKGEDIRAVKTLFLRWYATFIKKNKFDELGGFDERIKMPANVLDDYTFMGVLKDSYAYIFDNVSAYKYVDSTETSIGNFDDHEVLKEKWDMNYFNIGSNTSLLSHIKDQPRDTAVNALEIGCDCGGNLLGVKRIYPNAKLFGFEINENSAKIAAKFAEVKVGDIEKKDLSFGGEKMDYIIFGDVLEHLRDPESVLVYCKTLLKENGKILASIPNIAHFTVIRELLSGRFTYMDMGLLDRTHIHFFTAIEINEMFERAGYKVDELASLTIPATLSPGDEAFVNELMRLGHTDEYNFRTYQYHVLASKR